MAGQENSKLIAVNRKARHDYFVMEAWRRASSWWERK